MTFHERLKGMRELKNITQREVAQYLGITPNAYQKYEYGEREPDLITLDKICCLFSVSADYLIRSDIQETSPRKYTVPNEVSFDNVFDELCDMLRKLNSNEISRAFNSLLFFCRHLFSEYLHSKEVPGLLRTGKAKANGYSHRKYYEFRKQFEWEIDSLLKAVYLNVYKESPLPPNSSDKEMIPNDSQT